MRREDGAFSLPDSLDARVKKEVVFDEGQSRRVDAIVESIQNTKDPRERSRLTEFLIVNVHRLLMDNINIFFTKYSKYISLEKLEKEDVYMEALRLLIKYLGKWQNREARTDNGETPSSFNNYFFYSGVLLWSLRNKYVLKHLRDQRQGVVVSLSDPIGAEEGGVREDLLPDSNAVSPDKQARIDQKRRVLSGEILSKIYSDQDPISSLIIILLYGLSLDRDILDRWKLMTDRVLAEGAVSKVNIKYISKIQGILTDYSPKNRTLEEVAALLGISKEGVRQREKKTLATLKNVL